MGDLGLFAPFSDGPKFSDGRVWVMARGEDLWVRVGFWLAFEVRVRFLVIFGVEILSKFQNFVAKRFSNETAAMTKVKESAIESVSL